MGDHVVIAKRRPTDFDSSLEGMILYNGTCCCCCCLHWIGAVVGGGIGYAQISAKKQRVAVKRALHIGSALGMILAIGLTILAMRSNVDLFEAWGLIVALAPFVFFIPSLGLLVLSGLRSRRVDVPMTSSFSNREQQPGGKERQGAYRDAAASEHWTVDSEQYRKRTRGESIFLWKAVGRIFGFSLLGTAAGYLVMVFIWLILDAS